MTKRTRHSHTRQKRHRNNRRTMKGGAFSQQELQQLQNNGFNEFQIEELEHLNIPFNTVMEHVDTIMNQGDTGFNGNSDAMAEQVMNELVNQIDMDNSFDTQGTMNIDELNTSNMSGYTTDSDNSIISQGPMNIDELNTSNMSGYTTEADESFGGKKSNKRKNSSKRKGQKRRGRKTRKMRKYKGGACFGNGVGSNHYDPNYSIHNTNMLKLFPYKP